MSLGKRLKEAREAKKLTQKQLAEMIGAKHNSVSNWENDQNKPDMDKLQLICSVLDIDISTLLSPKNEILENVDDEELDDIWALREQLRRRPEMKMLFSCAKNVTKEEILLTVQLLERMKNGNNNK